MRGRRVPPKQVEKAQVVPPSQPLTLEALQNAAKIHAVVPYQMQHKLTEAELGDDLLKFTEDMANV